MKTNLLLKQIDFALQLAAIIIPTIIVCFAHWPGCFFIGYFALGLVQLVSCLFNASMQDKFSKLMGRRYYERALIVVVVMGILSCIFLSFFLFIYLFLLLFVTPVMAITYITITYKELSFLNRLVNRKKFTW